MIKHLMISVFLFTSLITIAQKRISENSFKVKNQPELKVDYLAYVPKTYYSQPRYTPVLISLHGGDEIGGDIARLKKTAPLSFVEKGQEFDFIIIAPHLPNAQTTTWDPELVKQALEDARSKFRIDPSRVYIMGFGKGGAGAWAFALKYPDLVAAAIPITGYGEVSHACQMKDIPTWAFHKTTIPNNSTFNMVRALRKCSNVVMYDEYTDAWSYRFGGKDVFDWMLAQSRNRSMVFGKNKINDKLTSYKLPLALKNASGVLKGQDGTFWSVNDGQGKLPLMFNFDTTGKVIRTVRIQGATNVDWEDLTQDSEGNIFIGDIGNENNLRKSFQVYKIAGSKIKADDNVPSETISFTLPDQREFPPTTKRLNFDLEAMFWHNKAIYFLSKNRSVPFSGYTKLYKVPDVAGSYVAQLMDSIKLDGATTREAGWITSAAISADASKLVLLGHEKVWVLTGFKPDQFSKGKVTTFTLPYQSSKKGIAFNNDTTLLITDEYFLGTKDGNLYFLKLE
jgi:predicted esterase